MAARVLVVDDVDFNVKLLQTKLEQEYYEVITASGGLEAIEKMKLEKPDIVLMDAMMPDLNGVDAIKRIKDDPEISHIPIVVITALNSQTDKVESLQAGADDFLTKPINDKALSLRMKSLIRIKQLTDEWRLRSSSMGELDSDNDAGNLALKSDVTNAKILMIDDDIIQMRQIADFLKDHGIEMSFAKTTSEGMKMIESGEFELIVVSTVLIDEDGLRFCSQFRAQEEYSAIPILILVDEADSVTLDKSLEIGLTDYVVTPVDFEEFFARSVSQIRRKRFQEAVKSSISESVSASFVDPLTQLYNRRYFDIHSDKLAKKSENEGIDLCLLMIDLDHFKNVNDSYGHPSGDAVLEELAKRIKNTIRPYDLAARFGGEEFVIILNDNNIEDSKTVAERIRVAVESEMFKIPEKPGEIRCTCSIGLSMKGAKDSIQTLLDRADKCLYKAKEGGRNQVVVFEEGGGA